MPDLNISVDGVEVVPFAVAPTLAFKLRVANADADETVHTVVLRCQIQIEVTRRRYSVEDQVRLRDLFGEPQRWGQTLKNLHWANASTMVPQFTGATTVELQVPCTFDFSVATTKYFNGLTDGDIPVCVMFSGTVFYAGSNGALQAAPISWATEAKYRLPLSVWKQMMDTYYPNTAWLCLRRDVFEELLNFKVREGIPTWEQAVERLLAARTQEAVAS
jgi:hypothetical protein